MSLLSAIFGPRRLSGYLPDTPDSRDQLCGALGLPGSPPASAMRLAGLVPRVLDQGWTESCVGHAIASGLWVARRAFGQDAEQPSPRFIYFHARGYHGGELVDTGTFLRTGLRGVQRFGYAPEQHCPTSRATINRSPSWAAYRHAHDSGGLRGYYRIASEGSERIDEIKRALAADHPVVLGTGVSQSFKSYSGTGTVTRPAHSAIVGRHAMCVVGYEGDRFRVLNSWGRLWGDGGFVWITDTYLAWDETRDIWVLDVEGAGQ